jgi:DNA ligase-1
MAGAAAWAVPAHKCVPGTRFVVDGFRHAHPSVTAYFLTHAHSDHYTGLSDKWQAPVPVYCTEITARLIRCVAAGA